MDQTALSNLLPFLTTASPTFKEAFFDRASTVRIPKGGMICMEDNLCAHLPIVVSGAARVYKADDEGKELTLYTVEAGESCILTASCILNQLAFPANATAATDVEALVVPTVDVHDWMQRFEEWRMYIFGLVARRLADVITLVEEVAFQQMDVRLEGYLFAQSAEHPIIKKTHEQMALDLGTSREVVSRLLKELEKRSIITLSRGQVHIMERDSLRHTSV